MVDPTPQTETFIASRWTRGNLLFPTRIVVTPEHVLRVKPRLFGGNQESIAIGKVASIQISTGLRWSEIRIESSGGTTTILSHGHSKRETQRTRDSIEKLQTTRAG